MLHTLSCRYSQRAFLYGVPIGGVAGLIGLGGGEFRLPVLTQVIGFPMRAAIPLNLLISFATLSFALATRNHAVPVYSGRPFSPTQLPMPVVRLEQLPLRIDPPRERYVLRN